MHKQESPKHSELRQGIISRLNSSHPFLPVQSNADVCCLNHGDIIGPIPDGQGYLVEMFPDDFNDVLFLNWLQSAAYDSLAVLGQHCQAFLVLLGGHDGVQIRALD